MIDLLYRGPRGDMWMRRFFWTRQRRQNVWLVGAARSTWWIFSEQVHELEVKQEQEMIPLKEDSSLQPLRQGRSLTAQLQYTREQLGSNWGAIEEWLWSKWSIDHWCFMINKRCSKKLTKSLYSLTLHPHGMKLSRLKIENIIDVRKMDLNVSE